MGKGYLFTIKKRRSFPQALTLAAGAMICMMISWHQAMASYLPAYFTFVHQTIGANSVSIDGSQFCPLEKLTVENL